MLTLIRFLYISMGKGWMSMTIKNDAERIVQAALHAAMPDTAVKKALAQLSARSGRLILVAAGKAAWQMAKAASDELGSKITKGLVITKYDHVKGELPGIQCFEAGHPVPDANSFKATAAAIDAVTNLTDKDTVLFLVSGGGSALFEKPLVSGSDSRILRNNYWPAGQILRKSTRFASVYPRLKAVNSRSCARRPRYFLLSFRIL